MAAYSYLIIGDEEVDPGHPEYRHAVMTIRVTFICLGNICRSPMAEGVFQKLVDDEGLSNYFEIDSAGTSSWHVGEKAHSGTRRELARHGIQYQGRARQLGQRDVTERQTYLIAMDRNNISDIKSYFGAHDRLYRLLDFASKNSVKDVPDPYYNGRFGYVYELVEDGCIGLLAKIRKEEGI